jgi:hypothetical protein
MFSFLFVNFTAGEYKEMARMCQRNNFNHFFPKKEIIKGCSPKSFGIAAFLSETMILDCHPRVRGQAIN